MIQVSKQQITEILDGAPIAIRDAFWSENNINFIYEICGKNHLALNKIMLVGSTVAHILLGLAHPEDLANLISNETGIDERIAKEISHAITSRVLAPIAPELNKTYGFHLSPIPTPSFAQPVQAKSIKQADVAADLGSSLLSQIHAEPPIAPSTPAPNPLVIHEHADTIPNIFTSPEANLVRPHFEFMESGESNILQEAPRAHLEIGSTQEEIWTTRIGNENARVIHYEAPEAPVDPFAATPAPPVNPTIQQDIPPSNVVNLKDLPK